MHMFKAQFFKTNPMEVFSTFQEDLIMVLVDKLTKYMEEYIMYVLKCFKAHAAFVCSPIFKEKFSRNICIVSGSHLHGALGGRGLVDPGQGGVEYIMYMLEFCTKRKSFLL